jgi:hypothetical protein
MKKIPRVERKSLPFLPNGLALQTLMLPAEEIREAAQVQVEAAVEVLVVLLPVLLAPPLEGATVEVEGPCGVELEAKNDGLGLKT